MHNEDRLVLLQMLVALNQILQSFYNRPMSSSELAYNSHYDAYYQAAQKEYVRVFEILWPTEGASNERNPNGV
jgi:hypothetical protein